MSKSPTEELWRRKPQTAEDWLDLVDALGDEIADKMAEWPGFDRESFMKSMGVIMYFSRAAGAVDTLKLAEKTLPAGEMERYSRQVLVGYLKLWNECARERAAR